MLFIATEYQHEDVVVELLRNGANPNLANTKVNQCNADAKQHTVCYNADESMFHVYHRAKPPLLLLLPTLVTRQLFRTSLTMGQILMHSKRYEKSCIITTCTQFMISLIIIIVVHPGWGYSTSCGSLSMPFLSGGAAGGRRSTTRYTEQGAS